MCGVPKDWAWIFCLQTIQGKIRAWYALDTLNRRDTHTHEIKHGYRNCTSVARLNSFGFG